MNMQNLSRVSCATTLAFIALAVTACTIPLRSDEGQKMVETMSTPPDPLAAKLAECRSVTYEQKDALVECRKAWAEKRRQFLGERPEASADSRMPQAGSSLFVTPKDESRLPSGYPSIQQNGKE
jgi:conjugative transfer region protein TrbK